MDNRGMSRVTTEQRELLDYAAEGPHVMQRDVYDALELSAEATGGLIPDLFTGFDDRPACLYGHAAFVDGMEWWVDWSYVDPESAPALSELRRLGLPSAGVPDAAIRMSRRRRGKAPFAAVMKRLNIVRGDK